MDNVQHVNRRHLLGLSGDHRRRGCPDKWRDKNRVTLNLSNWFNCRHWVLLFVALLVFALGRPPRSIIYELGNSPELIDPPVEFPFLNLRFLHRHSRNCTGSASFIIVFTRQTVQTLWLTPLKRSIDLRVRGIPPTKKKSAKNRSWGHTTATEDDDEIYTRASRCRCWWSSSHNHYAISPGWIKWRICRRRAAPFSCVSFTDRIGVSRENHLQCASIKWICRFNWRCWIWIKEEIFSIYKPSICG